MAVWTAPTTRSTGALVSASIWNTDIVENLKYLKDSPVFDGDVTVGDDLFLGSGAVVNFASDVTITHSTNTLAFAGAATAYTFADGPVRPATNDGVALGVSGTAWSDLFLASGSVIDFAAGDVTITHSSNALAFAGGTYTFNSNAGAAVANFNQANTGKTGLYLQENGTNVGSFSQLGIIAGTSDRSLAIFAETGFDFNVCNNGSATVKFKVTTGGNIAIGATAKLYLDGTAGTGDTYITEISGNRIGIYAGGVLVGDIYNNDIYFIAAYDTTTSDPANMNVTTGGRLRRSTSSIRYKHAVETLDTTEAHAAVMAMRPVTYRGKTDADQRRHVGFIAEEMQQIAPLLCTYDEGGESGTPNYVTYDRVTAYLVAVVQQQQAEIDALKARLH